MTSRTACLLTAVVLASVAAAAADKPGKLKPPEREIYIPFDQLNLLLEGPTRRVLLSRQEYEALVARAERTTPTAPPAAALLVSADYETRVGRKQAEIRGELVVQVLAPGLHRVGLDASGIGLRAAALDGRGAPLGRADDGRLVLFVEGRGTHKLSLDMVAPLATTAAQQVLHCRLPSPAAASHHLTIVGDVEVRSGAPVARRRYDEKANVTHIDLAPARGDLKLVMSLNSRLKRTDRLMVAGSVLVDEVTGAYERLHAAVSVTVLHRAAEQLRFRVPSGFDVTDVQGERLARWAMDSDVLVAHLREPATGRVVLNISALRTSPDLADWRFPRLEPLDVAGHAAVVGLLVEDGLRTQRVRTDGLVAIDTPVMTRAIPASVLKAEPGAPRLRPVVAFYSPQAAFDLRAAFAEPPAQLLAVTRQRLRVTRSRLELRAGFTFTPVEKKRFEAAVSLPEGWKVTAVLGVGNRPMPFELYAGKGKPTRVRIPFTRPVAPGASATVELAAEHVPDGWLDMWAERQVAFPDCRVLGATREQGAIAVHAADDLEARPLRIEHLTPLDEAAKADSGLAPGTDELAFRYDRRPFAAAFAVQPVRARTTAQTFSFFKVEPDVLKIHYELLFQVDRARVRQVRLHVPADAPADLSITGLDGVSVKEYTSRLDGQRRVWTVSLAERRRGLVRLAVDCEQRLASEQRSKLVLPIVQADRVAYQSGLAAVEGSPELEIAIATEARKVDVGELVDAKYEPGPRLLGVYEFVGQPTDVALTLKRPDSYGLPTAIVARAMLTTVLSARGASQTSAVFVLHAKPLFLEIRLPAGSTLWSATLDGKPTKPQREGDSLLLSLPAGARAAERSLVLTYQTPAEPIGVWDRIDVPGPKLFVKGSATAPSREAPVADLEWRLVLPPGYELLRADGVERRPVYELAVNGLLTALADSLPMIQNAREASRRTQMRNNMRNAGLAAHSFSTAKGRLPTATVPNPSLDRSRRLSLFVPLLPYLDEKALHDQFDLKKAWDDPVNATPSRTVVRTLTDPAQEADRDAAGYGLTHMVGVAGVGPDALDLPPNHPRAGVFSDRRGVRIRDIHDGTSNTFMFGQVKEGAGPWAAGGRPSVRAYDPRVAPINSGRPLNFGSTTAGGAHFMFADGSVRFISDSIDPSVFRALCTIRGNEVIDDEDNGGPHPPAAAAPRSAPMLAPAEKAAEEAAPEQRKADTRRYARRRTTVTVERERYQVVAASAPAKPKRKPPILGDLAGTRSLRISLQTGGKTVMFRSLGADPRLVATLGNRRALNGVALTLALLVAFLGVAAIGRPARQRMLYVVGVMLAATLLPMITGLDELVLVLNDSFYAACLLVLFYLAVGMVRVIGRKGARPAAAGLLVAVLALIASAGPAWAADDSDDGPPVSVPADAVIVPYDPEAGLPGPDAQKLLIPYARFQALWNRAYPDQPIGYTPPPTAYALAGAAFTSTLADGDALVVEGHVDVDLYTDKDTLVPLPLDAGVLARADVDGKPARLGMATLPEPGRKRRVHPVVVVYMSGKGRHRLGLALRMKLERQGGWRVTAGRVPRAPATELTVRVPQAGAQVRLNSVLGRPDYLTDKPDTTIRTTLGASGELHIQWRPKVLEGQVDQALTATSEAVLDVQEDRLQVSWRTTVAFRRGRRELFTLTVPAGYHVEKVDGANVRGWEVRPVDGGQRLTVSLLEKAKGAERLTVVMWRPIAFRAGKPTAFEAPVVRLDGAARHTGRLTIRRSPLLDVEATETRGATRTDLSRATGDLAAGALGASPLGLRPYQAYRFVSVPFGVSLSAAPVRLHASATVQSIVRLTDRAIRLETRVVFEAKHRPMHRLRVAVPANLRLDEVSAPGAFEWAHTTEADRAVVTVYLAKGVEGQASLLLRGEIEAADRAAGAVLPALEALDCARQQGHIVVQAPAGVDVRLADLKGLERVLPEQVHGWLRPAQRKLTRATLRYTASGYTGRVVLAERRPDVSCRTVTNVRVTDRIIEETVLVAFTIRRAGLREAAFLLPERMKDARVRVPLLRQKTVAPAGDGRVRVRLTLQDAITDRLRVLVEHDRLLTDGLQSVPVPIVETGSVTRQYAVIESAGRDEVVVKAADGLAPIDRRQRDFAAVADLLRGGISQAFVVEADAKAPRLAFQTHARAAVETAGARIGLAQTMLVLDAQGAYRARQTYKLDNTTEQALEVVLPAGAALWTARVAGKPVKPMRVGTGADRVRVPLVKTAPGDLDYEVVLQYGGRLPELGLVDRVEFPLMRTVNINVELSQVELLVPETHRWFDFGGTMRQVAERGDFEAGVLGYMNRVAERLIMVSKAKNPYAQARALSNLEQLGDRLQVSQRGYSPLASCNEALQTELSNTATVLQEAKRQQKQAAPPAQASDNRMFLAKEYSNQSQIRARGRGAVAGRNFDFDVAAPQQAAADEAGKPFSGKWLKGLGLQADKKVERQLRERVGVEARGVRKRPARLAKPQPPATPAPQQQAAMDSFAAVKLGVQQRQDLASRVQRYQTKLDRSKGALRRAGEKLAGPAAKAEVDFAGSQIRRGGALSVVGGRAGADKPGRVQAPPTGLASLDVRLPERGVRYRFTTPRGEITLSARVVPTSFAMSLGTLGVLVAAALVILALRHVLRRRRAA